VNLSLSVYKIGLGARTANGKPWRVGPAAGIAPVVEKSGRDLGRGPAGWLRDATNKGTVAEDRVTWEARARSDLPAAALRRILRGLQFGSMLAMMHSRPIDPR